MSVVRTSEARIASLILTVVIGIGAVLMLVPFYWLVVASTHKTRDIFSNPPNMVPGDQLWTNLYNLFTEAHFGAALQNSILVALLYALFGAVICTMAGYAFAKFSFYGQNVLFGLVLVILALPSQVTLVPLFQIMVNLNWLNTYQALILPNLALPFGIFLMRQTMQSVPDELIQAARVDGAGEFRIFLQIVLPIMRPALAALGIFMFLGQWNDFVYPLIVLRTPEAYTVPVALATLQGVSTTDYGQLLAGTAASVLPVLALFLFLQRQFVAGILAGAVNQSSGDFAVLLEGFASVLARSELEVTGVAVSLGVGCRVTNREHDGALEIISIESAGEPIRVSLEIPLGDAEGYWFPNAGSLRTLPPDWRGTDKTSIISSSPLGCLYDRRGNAILAFAFDQQVEESIMRFGVSEEHKSFVVYYEHRPRTSRVVRLALPAAGLGYAQTIGLLRDWLRDSIGAALPVPHAGAVPVYCTWYAFSQRVDAEKVEREAALAAELGCRAIIIDDGWQRHGNGRWYAGCGDWVPDPAKFPDLRANIDRLRGLGLSPMLWVAPFLLGPQSDAHARLKPYAPHHSEGLKAAVLDPRFAETRRHFVETCIRLVRDYGLAGLKIDFLDTVVVYQGTAGTGDIADVGQAVAATLAELRRGLADAGLDEALIEFRQSYIGPATAPYGNLLRAGDCPADAILNRRSVIDTRLIAAGQVVHADPVMWDDRAGAKPAARQVMNAYFGVPQLSMRLSELGAPQRDAIRTLLTCWMETRDTVLFGEVAAGLPSENYPLITARKDGRLVVGMYQPLVADLDLAGIDDLVLLNATSTDRLVLRLSGTATAFTGECRGPDGASAGPLSFEARDGLVELTVPVSGTAHLRTVAADSRTRA